MRNKIIHIILIVLIAISASAQDFHMSQYEVASQYLNPALTGMYSAKTSTYRLYSDYRTQWLSSSVKPYNSALIAFDKPFKKRNNNFGFGACIVNDNAGSGYLNTFNLLVSGAYDIMSSSHRRHLLSTGLQLGMVYRKLDPGSFTYDAQYSGSIHDFDASLPNEENFSRTSRAGFDAAFGIFYKYTDSSRSVHPFIGLSISHLTRPNESFTETKMKSPMRFNIHGGCEFWIEDKLRLIPRFLYMNEAHASELNIGMLSYYRIGDTQYETLLQCDYRNKDAVVLGIGLKKHEHIFRISYDVNASSLGSYLGGGGSFEFGIIFSGR
jgi:type IX secretion system PorP/SprF family membrane protein